MLEGAGEGAGEDDRRRGSVQINCQPQSLFTDGHLSLIKSAFMTRLSTWQGTVARIVAFVKGLGQGCALWWAATCPPPGVFGVDAQACCQCSRNR